MLQRLSVFNRRTMDVLGARVYSYYSLSHERTGTLPEIRRCGGATLAFGHAQLGGPRLQHAAFTC